MKTIRCLRNVMTPVPVVTALFLTACGGGGGDSGSNPPPPPPPPPPPDVALVPADTPVLFFVSTFQSNDGADTVTGTVNLFVPQTGERTALQSNESFSFARSSIATFTFDDRLFTLRNSGDSSGFGGGDWTEADVAASVEKSDGQLTGPLAAVATVATNQGTTWRNCLAVVGDALYWKPADSSGLLTVDLRTSGVNDGTLLIPNSDNEDCFGIVASADGTGGLATRVGGMDVADGQWYDTRFDPDSGLMEFFTRDPSDGRPTAIASFMPPDHAQYNRAYSFGFDNGAVYWARVNAGNQQVEIWRYEFVGEPQLLLSAQVDGVDVLTVSQLDVDDGYVALVAAETLSFTDANHVVLFDSNTGAAQLIDLLDVVPPVGGLQPPSFRDLKIMFRAQ